MRKKTVLTRDMKKRICELRKRGWTIAELKVEFSVGYESLLEVFKENGLQDRVYKTASNSEPEDSIEPVQLTYAKPVDITPERVVIDGKRYLDVTKEFFYRNEIANASEYFDYSPQMEGAFSFSY